VASDAAADPFYMFADLANAIERCRTDFGVCIEIDVSSLKPSEHDNKVMQPFVIGKIHYSSDTIVADDGWLILIKPALIQDRTPADVAAYAERNSVPGRQFPQQPTSNQFFDDHQFEAYRSLGKAVGDSAAEEIKRKLSDTLPDLGPAKIIYWNVEATDEEVMYEDTPPKDANV
jgi:hypothetical protein